MFTSIATFRAWLRAVWQRLVNAARAGWHTARPGAHYAWETFRKHLRAAFWQAVVDWIDEVATAAKEKIALPPQGDLPAAL